MVQERFLPKTVYQTFLLNSPFFCCYFLFNEFRVNLLLFERQRHVLSHLHHVDLQFFVIVGCYLSIVDLLCKRI